MHENYQLFFKISFFPFAYHLDKTFYNTSVSVRSGGLSNIERLFVVFDYILFGKTLSKYKLNYTIAF